MVAAGVIISDNRIAATLNVKINFLPLAFVFFLSKILRRVSTAPVDIPELLVVVLILGN